MVRFILTLLTYISLSLSASKTRSKNDSEILIAFSERLLESTEDNQKTSTAIKPNCYLLPKDMPLLSHLKSIKHTVSTKNTVHLLVRVVVNRARDHSIAQ